MDALLVVFLVAGGFLSGIGLERLRRLEKDFDELRQVITGRRVPYRVVEEVENRQARIVDRLLWVKHTLDEVDVAMRQQVDLYNQVLDRDPLEGDGRGRHKVSRQ